MNHHAKIAYVDVVRYFNEASKYASIFQQEERGYPDLYYQKSEFEHTNVELLRMKPLKRIVMVICVPLHMAAIIFETMQLSPIVEGIVFGQGGHSEMMQRFLALMTMFTLMGCSLLAGYCFHEIKIRRDDVAPDRWHLTWGWLAGAIAFSLLYVGSILWVIQKTTGLGSGFDVLYFLGFIAVMEVALSVAAVIGYTYIIQFLQYRSLGSACKRSVRNMYYAAEKCNLSFRNHRVSLGIYNQENQTNIPCIDTPAIATAISFHEGFYRPKNWPPNLNG